MKKLCITIFGIMLMTSCEKEINFDYKSVPPVYVIEGRITNETTEVIITKTRDIANPTPGTGIDNAFVLIESSNNQTETLQYQSDGYYRSPNGTIGKCGEDYTLTVRIGNEEFVSTSHMSNSSRIDSLYLYWMDALGDKFLFLRFRFEDLLGEENYYYSRVYRNGRLYKWNLTKDQGANDTVIEENIMCMSESTAKKNKKEDHDEILYEGDTLELELQTIDRRTYDYLQSLNLSESTSANPVYNFSTPCMGYFSAYSVSKKYLIFKYDNISSE